MDVFISINSELVRMRVESILENKGSWEVYKGVPFY